MIWKYQKLLALIVFSIVTASIVAGNDPKPQVVVFPFKSNQSLQGLLQGIEDVLRSELIRSGYFIVVEQERMYEFIKETVLYNFIKIEDVDVETALPRATIVDLFARVDLKVNIRIAEKLKADFAVKGSLNQFGEKFRADIEVVNVKGKETLGALVGECDSQERISEMMEEISQQIVDVCKGASILNDIDHIQGSYQQGNFTYEETSDRLKSLSCEMPGSFLIHCALFLHYLGHHEMRDGLIEEGEEVINLFNPDSEADIRYLSLLGMDPFYELANVYSTMGKIDNAIKVYNRAIRVYPLNHTRYYKQLGVLYKREGQTELAISAFKKVLNVNPADYETRVMLASVYEAKGDISNALEQYRHSLNYATNAAESSHVKEMIKRLQSKKGVEKK